MEQLHLESNKPGENPLISKTLHQEPNTSAGDDETAKDEKSKSSIPSPIQQLFGLQTLSQSECSSCQHEQSRTTYPFVVDMLYPKKVSI